MPVHHNDVIMSAIASQITSPTIVYSIVYSGADQRKHQSSASLAFVRGIHRWPMNSPHKEPVTRKMFPFDDVIMIILVHPKPEVSNESSFSGVVLTSCATKLTHWPLGNLNEILDIKFQTDFSDWWLRHLLWNCLNMNVTGLHWWSVNIGSGNGLVPSVNKPLPEPMST